MKNIHQGAIAESPQPQQIFEKTCSGCKVLKPLTEYYKNSSQIDGRNNYCIPCWKLINKKHSKGRWDKTSPEAKRRHLNRCKTYYELNKEQVDSWRAKWKEENRETLLEKKRHQSKEYNKRPEVKARTRQRAKNLKYEVLNAYGGVICKCCGETIVEMLTLDHINNDGSEHRKSMKSQWNKMYAWAKRWGYPPIFQVLCFNCNIAKYFNKGICPHKQQTENN